MNALVDESLSNIKLYVDNVAENHDVDNFIYMVPTIFLIGVVILYLNGRKENIIYNT